MSKSKPTYKVLEARLRAAESIVEALKNHEVDAVVGEEKLAFLLVREVEEALWISDAAFRAMFELSAVGMMEAESPGFRITRVNRKFCDILGFSAEECLSKTYIGITDPKDCNRDMRMVAKILTGEADSWSIEKHCVRKDGSLVLAAVDGAVVRDRAGRAVKIVAMVRELSSGMGAEGEMHDTATAKRKANRPKKAAVDKRI